MPEIPLSTASLAAFHAIPSTSSNITEPTRTAFARTQLPQTKHRLDIIDAWGGKAVFEGKCVLELGCGQGDASVALAAAVSSHGKDGRVVAWDPADGNYGSPLTLAQAQQNILSNRTISSLLSFSLTTPLASVLRPSEDEYEIAALIHSIYYFPSPSILLQTLKDLHAHYPPINHLFLAEHGLHASQVDQQAHLLAVLAQAGLESLRQQGESTTANIRTVLAPDAIAAVALEAGWRLVKERMITPDLELQDGRWEVGTVVSTAWMDEVDQVLSSPASAENGVAKGREREKAWIRATRDSTKAAVEGVAAAKKGEDGEAWTGKPLSLVRNMDVWCAVFVRQ
ncbi:hypothetical protein QFC22_004975 [Naganishia vaughanmartiniae]|uniref:Uncharacterized protein n=1 Tax=Naganishia vaughanmartiniae TaxID=1424756 RepID=A0ACC2WWK3_9TREE|nr:hypothetical protein QFC22_004975 [Naganishia vaughanmartiniae]